MIKRLFIFGFIILSSACAPSLVGLMKLEDIQDLHDDTLYVFLSDRDDDINLHRKYNQNRRADRLKRQTDNFNQNLEDAFRQNYSFSQFNVTKDSKTDEANFYVTIDITENYGERNDQFLIQLNVRNSNDEIVETVFKESSNDTNYNLKFLVRQLDRKLKRKYKQALKMQGI
ncbi:hypothetical protein ACFOUP_11665 [Belliella kenyensis]|uniref:Lipoprotein n=1 Tax=Belliella kenyensis TaxID=1472724 RepID=A0ABV8EP67_9BACT|nr:hypothetical protein [Belliella kenyensis]MCH7400620.1 hypothetical protein [Belliella kenyensis]MDN3602093.1 hypothetical protein [Belliella kenyensis]